MFTSWIAFILFLFLWHLEIADDGIVMVIFILLNHLVCLTIAINIYIYKALQMEQRRTAAILNNQKSAKVTQRRACRLVLLIVAAEVVTSITFLILASINNICHVLYLKCIFNFPSEASADKIRFPLEAFFL